MRSIHVVKSASSASEAGGEVMSDQAAAALDAYLRTAQMQWTNFSAWLIAGALVGGGHVVQVTTTLVEQPRTAIATHSAAAARSAFRA